MLLFVSGEIEEGEDIDGGRCASRHCYPTPSVLVEKTPTKLPLINVVALLGVGPALQTHLIEACIVVGRSIEVEICGRWHVFTFVIVNSNSSTSMEETMKQSLVLSHPP